jgi:hypothetical protein
MSTRQRSDKTAKYKASFIYIMPSSLAKISFILGPKSITPIVYKNQVSGYGFWTNFFMVFSYTVFLNNMFLRYRGASKISGKSKKNNNRRAERGENFFWYQDFMQKSYFFYL